MPNFRQESNVFCEEVKYSASAETVLEVIKSSKGDTGPEALKTRARNFRGGVLEDMGIPVV